jgi:multidrug resistance efflux pump
VKSYARRRPPGTANGSLCRSRRSSWASLWDGRARALPAKQCGRSCRLELPDTQQALDEAQKNLASARADEEAEANYAAAKAGPTKEQLAIADAGVEAAASGLAVLERRLDKTTLRAPADGVVTEVVAEVGEAISCRPAGSHH